MTRVLSLAAILTLASCAPAASPDQAGSSELVPLADPVDFVLIDKSERQLVLYAKGRPVRMYSGLQFGDAPLGHKQFEGDERTPEGRYTIDTRNPNSAFHLSLRISYPNAQDRAFAQSYGASPGGDIFIHGQPNGLTSGRMRGDWTDGCVALTNAEIEQLWQYIADGTPIEIRQ